MAKESSGSADGGLGGDAWMDSDILPSVADTAEYLGAAAAAYKHANSGAVFGYRVTVPCFPCVVCLVFVINPAHL